MSPIPSLYLVGTPDEYAGPFPQAGDQAQPQALRRSEAVIAKGRTMDSGSGTTTLLVTIVVIALYIASCIRFWKRLSGPAATKRN